jgi:hypothetical protein
MGFIHKDYSLPEGKWWTLRGWYRHGVQELKALIILLPLVALLAWGAYTMISGLCRMYPELARAGQVYFWVCVAAVPFSALIFSRFLWWGALVLAVVIYPVAYGLSAWVLGLLLVAIPLRGVFALICLFGREGRAPEYVHVIGVSGWQPQAPPDPRLGR